MTGVAAKTKLNHRRIAVGDGVLAVACRVPLAVLEDGCADVGRRELTIDGSVVVAILPGQSVSHVDIGLHVGGIVATGAKLDNAGICQRRRAVLQVGAGVPAAPLQDACVIEAAALLGVGGGVARADLDDARTRLDSPDLAVVADIAVANLQDAREVVGGLKVAGLEVIGLVQVAELGDGRFAAELVALGI